MCKKPKILLMIMSADLPFFKGQLEDCKSAWLSCVEEQADVIGKYADIANWYYYDAPFGEKVKYAGAGVAVAPDGVIEDPADSHHLINMLYDDRLTFQKTYDALKYVTEKYDYDYIIRTNTSTYLNLPLLSYCLFREFNDDNGWQDVAHCSDLLSAHHIKCPESGDVYMRGNCLALTRRQVADVILKYGRLYAYGAGAGFIDDVCIGCLLNNYYNGFETSETRDFEYLAHIKCLPQTWYKCTETPADFGHAWAPRGYMTTLDERDGGSVMTYASCAAIQIRSYYTRQGRDITERAHYAELHEKMEKHVFPIYKHENNLINIYENITEYARDPMVWAQGNLPYARLSYIKALLRDPAAYGRFVNFLFRYTPRDHFLWPYKERIMRENNLNFMLEEAVGN